jgi:hypothetical protein
MVARTATHNVTSKKAIARFLSLISPPFVSNLSFISMNNISIYAFRGSDLVLLSNYTQFYVLLKVWRREQYAEIKMDAAF